MKKNKAMYVTFHWLKMYGNRSELKAIKCDTMEQIQDTASDICSLQGIRNVRINLCGRLPKNATIIDYDLYKNNFDSIL